MAFDPRRLRALLHVYLAEEGAPSSRAIVVRSARPDWLYTDFLDSADESSLRDRLIWAASARSGTVTSWCAT